MDYDQLLILIDLMVRGDISEEDRQELQAVLKKDASARQVFRDRMDLEVGLRTLILEQPEKQPRNLTGVGESACLKPERTNTKVAVILYSAVCLAVCLMVVAVILILDRWTDDKANQIVNQNQETQKQEHESNEDSKSLNENVLGSVLVQADSRWSNEQAAVSNELTTGPLKLESGVAEIQFDSGTHVIMEAPCELVVTSHDSAKLVRGNVFVNVTELSNGFVLETKDAKILDEGTEFAVSLKEDQTEVHVFDGSVVWSPNDSSDSASEEELIEAGMAVVFEGQNRATVKRIPFGQRQFVRRLEFQVKQQGGDALKIYDGFENLAGRIRRGRSGIGWDGGWKPAGRGRRSPGEVVDCPNDSPFGFQRHDRRELKLTNGNIRRLFKESIDLKTSSTMYVSFLLTVTDEIGNWSARMSLEADGIPRRRGGLNAISFGFSRKGFPFLNSGRSVNETASVMSKGIYFCVVKVSKMDKETDIRFRIYPLIEEIDSAEPSTWTVGIRNKMHLETIKSIRLVSEGSWMIDELKIGRTWEAVTTLKN